VSEDDELTIEEDAPGVYCPDAEEIAAACAKIREGWSAETLRTRSCIGRDCHVETPVVRLGTMEP
jgi:hypothetical protein